MLHPASRGITQNALLLWIRLLSGALLEPGCLGSRRHFPGYIQVLHIDVNDITWKPSRCTYIWRIAHVLVIDVMVRHWGTADGLVLLLELLVVGGRVLCDVTDFVEAALDVICTSSIHDWTTGSRCTRMWFGDAGRM